MSTQLFSSLSFPYFFAALAVVLTLAALKPLPNLLEIKFYSPETTK